MNSAGVLGLGYTQLLRPGVTATLGMLVDTKSLGQKSAEQSKTHSLGLQLKVRRSWASEPDLTRQFVS